MSILFQRKPERVRGYVFDGFNDRDIALYCGCTGYDVAWFDRDGKSCTYLDAASESTILTLHGLDRSTIELRAGEVLYQETGGPWQTMPASQFAELYEPAPEPLGRRTIASAYTTVRACSPEDMLKTSTD